MVQYVIFPVFLLFVVISGHQAGAVIRAYAASLFWIRLWAPLYAVMNFIITMVSRSQYASGSTGNGLSIEQMSFLHTAIDGLRGGVEMSAKLRNSAEAARSLEEMAQAASESGFGRKVGSPDA